MKCREEEEKDPSFFFRTPFFSVIVSSRVNAHDDDDEDDDCDDDDDGRGRCSVLLFSFLLLVSHLAVFILVVFYAPTRAGKLKRSHPRVRWISLIGRTRGTAMRSTVCLKTGELGGLTLCLGTGKISLVLRSSS